MRATTCVLAILGMIGCTYASSLRGDATGDPSADTTAPDTTSDTPLVDVVPDATGPCEPGGDGVWIEWTFDGSEGWEEMDLEVPCTIDSVEGYDVGHSLIDLTCGTGAVMTHHRIEIFSNPHTRITEYVGSEVMLRYISHPWEWTDRWLTLRHMGGGLMLALVTGSSLCPWESTLEEWYDPVGLRVLTGLCPVTIAECGPEERPGIEVTYADESGLVFDGGYEYVGSTALVVVVVAEAWHYSEMHCFDFPLDFFDAMLVLPMEG